MPGTGNYIRIAPLAEALLADQLAALDAQLERDMRPLAMEMADPSVAAKATRLRQAYEADVAALGDTLFAAIAKAAKDADLGLCANPPSLGGCNGQDVSKDQLPVLAQHKKVLKALK